MLGEGAQMTDDEFEKVVVYLSVVLGKKIKINEASAETSPTRSTSRWSRGGHRQAPR